MNIYQDAKRCGCTGGFLTKRGCIAVSLFHLRWQPWGNICLHHYEGKTRMRPSGIIIAAASIGLLLAGGAVHAQGFYFTSTFTPATITDSKGGVSGGGTQLDITGQSTPA